MIKEEKLKEVMEGHPIYRPPSLLWKIKDTRPKTKGGIANKHGVRCMQDRLTMEGNHNLLFGTVDGLPLGICYCNAVTNRSLNAFILQGDTDKGVKNYITPNLLAKHGSAVVVGADEAFNEYGATLLKEGVNFYLFQFSTQTNAVNRYNPFSHFKNPRYIKPIAAYMAGLCQKLFHTETDKFVLRVSEDAEKAKEYFSESLDAILTIVFYYVFKSDALHDSERSFKTAERILCDVELFGKQALEKRVLPDTDSLLDSLSVSEELLAPLLGAVLNDLSPLITSSVFSEDENIPQLNFSVEKLVNELTYTFIPTPKTQNEKALTEFLLAMLLRELYDFGENNWKHSNQALENPVYFYLNDFAEYEIPNFLNFLATTRPYGIGLSCIAHSLQELRSMYKEMEFKILLANVDTNLFLDMTGEDDYEYIARMMPVRKDANGNKIPESKLRRMSYGEIERNLRKDPALSEQEVQKLFSDNKAVVVIRDFYPVICDTLNPDDKNT